MELIHAWVALSHNVILTLRKSGCEYALNNVMMPPSLLVTWLTATSQVPAGGLDEYGHLTGSVATHIQEATGTFQGGTMMILA